MTDVPDPARERQGAGLCASCRHARRVTSARGSMFSRCERATDDPSFPKYPRLPVIQCCGHEPCPGMAPS
ncbi:MAG TPA: hypothetical protein DCQ64_31960 [Candidatus Rokubacteria bacterium]|nr:hypothetical protein [Candidatus Rokubacteria bacterium]